MFLQIYFFTDTLCLTCSTHSSRAKCFSRYSVMFHVETFGMRNRIQGKDQIQCRSKFKKKQNKTKTKKMLFIYGDLHYITNSFCKNKLKQIYSGLCSKLFLFFLGASAGLRRATISFVMSLHLSVYKKWSLIGRIFMKCCIGVIF